MKFSEAAAAFIGDCGRVMSKKEAATLNLFELDGDDLDYQKEIIDELAKQVEEYSQGLLTVRECDIMFFATRIRGRAMYLVVCDYAIPKGKVAELTDDMVLYILTSGPNGLMKQQQPSKEQIARVREAAVSDQRASSYAQQGNAETKALLARLIDDLQKRTESAASDTVKKDAKRALQYTICEQPRLEYVAAVCAALGISLDELLKNNLL